MLLAEKKKTPDQIIGITFERAKNIVAKEANGENIAGKEENAGKQHFLPFPQGFQKPFYTN